MTKKFTVKDMVLCALLAAMTGILSQIGIPIGEIPINLALFSVYLAGGLLGSYKGAVSMVVYVMMGAVGLPVFSNFRGGLSVLAGSHRRIYFRIPFCGAGSRYGVDLLGRCVLEDGDWYDRWFGFVLFVWDDLVCPAYRQRIGCSVECLRDSVFTRRCSENYFCGYFGAGVKKSNQSFQKTRTGLNDG